MREQNTNSLVTRRELLELLTAAGGAGAALKAGVALGLMPVASAATVPDLPMAGRRGKKVAILGGGLSGLTVAYELGKRGYDCTILEASHRCGGRVFTIRHGDLIDEIGNPHYCEFDDEPHLYFNGGAARIPTTHRKLLHYCKELSVDLEIFVGENNNAYLQDDALPGGKPVRNNDYKTNLRGFLGEMLAKAMTDEQMNEPFTEAEAESLLGVIRSFGDLSENDLYKGSFRTGFKSGGYIHHGVQHDMLAFRDLLKSPMAMAALTAYEGEFGPALLQPVGGVDNIIAGFLRQVGKRVKYQAQVSSIQVSDSGINIAYDQQGRQRKLQVDYCFNCIPVHLVLGLNHNLPREHVKAMKFVRRGYAYKAAFQAKERFWEKEDIYGGITLMNNPSKEIWYPPHGIHKQKGVILSGYDFVGGIHFANMSQAERVEAHIRDGEKVHPGYRNLVEKPVTVAWHRMNHLLGCAARWNERYGEWTPESEAMFDALQRPVNGRYYVVGDQMTRHVGWMESAIHSAHWAMEDLAQRMRAAAP